MSRSAVALLIILTAILGYFSMVGVGILMRGAPEANFQAPQEFVEPSTVEAPSAPSAVAPNNDTAEPVAVGVQE